MGDVPDRLQRGLDVVHKAGLPRTEPLELVHPPHKATLLSTQPLARVLLRFQTPQQKLFRERFIQVHRLLVGQARQVVVFRFGLEPLELLYDHTKRAGSGCSPCNFAR